VNPERKLELKVGAFVIALVAVALLVLALLGSRRHVFASRVTLHAAFTDVQGLREGAPVWLSGVSVGQVSRIRFGEKHIEVDLSIVGRALDHMRADSVARIDSQGLLGDKIVSISLGSAGATAIRGSAWLHTAPPADFNRLVAQAGDILEQASIVARNAAVASTTLADPKTIAAFRSGIMALDALLTEAQRGRGLAHALFYDPKTARSITHMAGSVDHAVSRIDDIFSATDEEGRQVLNKIARAAGRVGDAAESIHRSNMIAHLDRASGDLADVIAYVKAGQGTIGALIADPGIYERVVALLGGLQRSRLLRWMVHYAIEKSDKSAPPAPQPVEARQRRVVK
jgi:phospholipid/cholesterol/gamma-HCH transport system substrate-binding protein